MLLNRYQVVKRLGAGGGGTVYEVLDDLRNGARLALKALWPEPGDRALLSALRAELGVMASIDHPLLCRVFDFGRLPRDAELEGAPSDGRPGYFLTRELISGDALSRVPSVATRELGTICVLLADAARGLDVLHRAGMRHGDFKPGNAIVGSSGRVRLIDFGLTVEERVQRAAGTLAYMAPEILTRRSVDRRADLYALGITLFELCAGELPSESRRGSALISWHMSGVRPRLEEIVPEAPASLVELAAALMAPDPDERLPSAAEAVVALEACARELGAEPIAVSDELVVPHLPRAQLGQLERALEARQHRGGSAFCEIIGEPGSGRTTILLELGWRLALKGVEVIRAGKVARGRPFGAMGSALERIAALTGLPSPLEQAATDPDVSQQRAWAAIADWLAAASERWPIAIMLDDFDYADEASRGLTEYLAFGLPDRARVMLYAARAGDAETGPGYVGRALQVVMGGLGEMEVSELVARTSGRRDRQLAAQIHRHTGGNMLHVVHILGELAHLGFPAHSAAAQLSLPPRLAGSVADSFAAASDDTRRLCEALAVLERPATVELVSALMGGAELGPKSPEHLRMAIDAAVDLRLCERDPGARVALRRPALRHSLYAGLTPERRAVLHRGAAIALEAKAGLDPRDPEVALHWACAGDPAEVRARVLEALARLSGAGDHAAALELGASSLELFGGASDRFIRTLRLEVGELARARGDHVRAARALEPLIGERRASAADRDRARLILGRAREEAGDPEGAEALWREVIAGGERDASRRAARELSRLFIKRGRSREALEVVDQAQASDGSLKNDLHLLCARAFAAGALEQDPNAEMTLVDAAERAGEGGDNDLRATALNYAAILSFRRGDFRAADRSQRRALDAARRGGDLVRIGTLRMNLATNAFHFGDYAGCLRELTSAVSILRAAGAGTAAVMARRNLGHLLVELGSYEQARVELSTAARSAVDLDLQVHVAGCEALAGIAEFRSGDRTGGLARVGSALEMFERIGGERYVAETLLDLVELELESPHPRDLDRAAAHLARLQTMDSTRSGSTRWARFLALSAWAAARHGHRDQAAAHIAELDGSAGELREQGGRHAQWSVDSIAAEVMQLLGDEGGAATRRRAALTILRQMEAGLPDAHRAAFWHDPRRRRLRASARSAQSTDAATTWMGSSELSGDRMFRLLEIYRRMSSERDVERLLEMVMDTAVELSGAERGFILVADRSRALRTAVARNLSAAQVAAMARADRDPSGASAHEVPYSRTVAERVYYSGELVLSNDPRQDPRFDDAQSVHALHIESVLCIPVHVRGQVVGVLYLESRFERVSFAESDLKLLMAFGDQVAIVLENARLLEVSARRAADLEHAHAEIEELLSERTELLERRTEELARARRDLATVRRRFLGDRGAYGLIGRAPSMERVFELIDRLAPAEVPVLILGESGTGKELVARALHEYSPQSAGPMVSVNCGALPESLLASELFGHERGAFTGADAMRRGLFEAAHGGTLFLDEVGDMPERMQAVLLRALQEGVIRRVGGTEDIAVDVRVVAATNRDLEQRVEQGKFREDLYYRLHVVPIAVPPLRDRVEDVPLLVEHFLQSAAARTGMPKKSISRRALRALMAYPWPGNVRQLEHAVTNALVLADGDEIEAEDFNLEGAKARASLANPRERQRRERERIIEALKQTNWNKSKAARLLEIPRRTFYRRLNEYGIQ